MSLNNRPDTDVATLSRLATTLLDDTFQPVVDVPVLGRHVDLLIRVSAAALGERAAAGVRRPILDYDVLDLWELSRSHFPPSGLTIGGAIVATSADRFAYAVKEARALRNFFPTTLVLNENLDDASDQRILECLYRDLGLASSTEAGTSVVVYPPTTRASQARRRTLDRWVEESVLDYVTRAAPELFSL